MSDLPIEDIAYIANQADAVSLLERGDLIKSLLLFFDSVAVGGWERGEDATTGERLGFAYRTEMWQRGVPEVTPVWLDPTVAYLEDMSALRLLPLSVLFGDADVNAVVEGIVSLLTQGAFPARSPHLFRELSSPDVARAHGEITQWMLDELVAQDLAFVVQGRKRIAHDSREIFIQPRRVFVSPDVATAYRVFRDQLTGAAGQRLGHRLHVSTAEPGDWSDLHGVLNLTPMPTAGRVVLADLEEVGIDLTDVPLDEVLDFRRQHGAQFRAYMGVVRELVLSVSVLDSDARRAALDEHAVELREEALALRMAARGITRRSVVGWSLGLMGAAWSASTGDPIGAAISSMGIAASGLPRKPYASAYSYLFGVQSRVSKSSAVLDDRGSASTRSGRRRTIQFDSPVGSPNEVLATAEALFATGAYSSALAGAEYAAANGDEHVSISADTLRASALAQLGERQEALNILRRIAETVPNGAGNMARRLLVILLRSEPDGDEELRECLRELSESDETSVAARACLDLGEIERGAGNTAEAVRWLVDAYNRHDSDASPRAALSLGELLLELDNPEWENMLRRAASSNHNDVAPRSSLLLGLALKDKGSSAEASHVLRHAVALQDWTYSPLGAAALATVLLESDSGTAVEDALISALDSHHIDAAPQAALLLAQILMGAAPIYAPYEELFFSMAICALNIAAQSGHPEYAPTARLLVSWLTSQGPPSGSEEDILMAVEGEPALQPVVEFLATVDKAADEELDELLLSNLNAAVRSSLSARQSGLSDDELDSATFALGRLNKHLERAASNLDHDRSMLEFLNNNVLQGDSGDALQLRLDFRLFGMARDFYETDNMGRVRFRGLQSTKWRLLDLFGAVSQTRPVGISAAFDHPAATGFSPESLTRPEERIPIQTVVRARWRDSGVCDHFMASPGLAPLTEWGPNIVMVIEVDDVELADAALSALMDLEPDLCADLSGRLWLSHSDLKVLRRFRSRSHSIHLMYSGTGVDSLDAVAAAEKGLLQAIRLPESTWSPPLCARASALDIEPIAGLVTTPERLVEIANMGVRGAYIDHVFERWNRWSEVVVSGASSRDHPISDAACSDGATGITFHRRGGLIDREPDAF